MDSDNVLNKIKSIDETYFREKPFFKKGELMRGYFISPSGVVEKVDNRHITAVLEEPERFGKTREELEEVFNRHEESWGSEGKAREEILLSLVNSGWIRIRQNYRNRSTPWTVNAKRMNETTLSRIYDFFERLSEETSFPEDQVWVDSTNMSGWYWISDILKFKMWKDFSIDESVITRIKESLKKHKLIFKLKEDQ